MPSRKDLIEDDEFERFVNKSRGEAFADRIFDFDDSPLEENDVDVSANTLGFRIEKSGQLDEDEFDAFTNSLGDSGMNFVQNRNHWEGGEELLDSAGIPDPIEQNRRRSETSVEDDRERRATVTSDVDKWADDPTEFDFPLVDTPPEFQEKKVGPFGMMSDIRNAGSDDELNEF